jgi:hypothetical protein
MRDMQTLRLELTGTPTGRGERVLTGMLTRNGGDFRNYEVWWNAATPPARAVLYRGSKLVGPVAGTKYEESELRQALIDADIDPQYWPAFGF